MAYVGIRLESNNVKVDVKLHGPTDKFNINTVELRGFVETALLKAHQNLMSMCQELANDVIDKYGNGEDILWAETEVETPNGVLVGASADKVTS